ncbi:MAG: peptidylprolyl isomerase [Armatimonadetes bacterium]|nr:peptidylprolyl isomerase [Armatimonadota bacterium]
MSLMAMSGWLKKYGAPMGFVFGAIVVVGGVVGGLGSNLSGGGSGAGQPGMAGAANEPAVAVIGTRKVTKSELDNVAQDLVARQSAQNPMMAGKQPPPEQMDRYRLAALQSFKEQVALEQVAKSAGITVTDADIQAERDKQWANGARSAIAAQLKLPPDATDARINSALLSLGSGMNVERAKESVLPTDRLRLGVLITKMTDKFKGQIAVNDAAVKQSLSDMTVRHILVKFGVGALPEAQAKNKAEKLLAAVKADATKMGELARTISDDIPSKAKGGVYEWTPGDRTGVGTETGRGIVPEFAAALDTLKPGETFPELVRVENPGYAGFHIIRLEAVKSGKSFPADFEKNKAQYLSAFGKERVNKRIQEAIDKAIPSVSVTLSDPFLSSEQLLEDAAKEVDKTKRNVLLNKAIDELGKVKPADDQLGIAPLKKATIYGQLGKNKEAIAAYEESLTFRRTPETRLALALAYAAEKQNDKAKEQLAKMEEGVIPDGQMYGAMAQLYSGFGDKAKAEALGAKAEAAQKAQMDAMIKAFQEQQAAQAPPAPAPPAPKAPASPAPAKK